MKDSAKNSSAKEQVGMAAANLVEDRMLVGLGTGSTAAFVIQRLGARIANDGLQIQCVTTSFQSTLLARQAGIPLLGLDSVTRLDISIDGADEIDPDLHLIKGGGAAHTLEKIVHALSDRFIVVADESKLSPFLGQNFAVPLEVLPAGRLLVERELQRLGAREIQLRMAQRKDGPVISDNGNMILDARFERFNPLELEQQLDAIPGVVACGIFARYRPARGDCLIGQAGGVRQL
ncbi:MAG: ribose-5-phosphate isomerase RpiA [Leptospiraceae bacterium]|nr:ribose-5-phosphate isomerase RpiA [Leptospiraceae bacterium]